MNHANIAFVSVGGKRYAVDLLNPIDAISWGNRALALFGPALGKLFGSIEFDKLEGIDLEKMGLMEVAGRVQSLVSLALASCGEIKAGEVSDMMTGAVQRCYTPQNESLGDMAVFNSWFRENPGDLYPLGVMALVRLVKDFFPSQLVTAASAFQARMTAGAAAQ
jgi:hypothetical protein